MVEKVGVDTCIHLVVVGRNTNSDQEVVAVYFYSPEVVLCVHLCLPVEPEAVVNTHFSACLGSLTSFSVFGVNLANVLTCLHLSEPDVLVVSEVSPFVVEVALGINAQQQEACC